MCALGNEDSNVGYLSPLESRQFHMSPRYLTESSKHLLISKLGFHLFWPDLFFIYFFSFWDEDVYFVHLYVGRLKPTFYCSGTQ